MSDRYYQVAVNGDKNTVVEMVYGKDNILYRNHYGSDHDYEVSPSLTPYPVDTMKKKVVLGLPSNPKRGDVVGWFDVSLSFSLHPLILHRNGQRIMGQEEHLCCNTNADNGFLTFINPTIGWVLNHALLQ